MPTFSQIDGVSKEIKELNLVTDGSITELKNLNAEIDGVSKELFVSDILDKISNFYLRIDYVGYYPVDSNNAFGSLVWINNATDFEESDWDNNVGSILRSKDGTQLILRSPIKYGSGKARVQASLCAKLKDGSSIKVTEANGFELDKLNIQSHIKGDIIFIVTGTSSRSCSRIFYSTYGTEFGDSNELYTNVFADSTSCSVDKTVDMTPITQEITNSYFILSTYGTVIGTDHKGYYYLTFTMLKAMYKDRLFDIGKISYYATRMKLQSVSVASSNIEEVNIVLSSYSSFYLKYHLSSGSSGSVALIKNGNLTSINQLNSYAQVTVSDSTLTVNPYYGATPSLYFFVYLKLSNGKQVHISRLSNYQQSCLNIPFTLYKRTVSSATSGSSSDLIKGYTRDEDSEIKSVSYNVYTGSDLTEHSWTININGCLDNIIECDMSTGFKPTNNFDVCGLQCSYGLGQSNSSSTTSPASPAAYLRWVLGDTTIKSNGSTRTVPTKFIVQGQTLNVGY